MENVKIPTSESYQTYLISRLSDPNYAAVYLETYLEEPAPEPELLQLALHKVAEALLGQSPDHAEFHQRQLDEWLAQPGSYAIHGLANWLNELGLKLTVTVNGSANGKSLGNIACGEIMPRKIRELKAQIAREGFVYLPKRGKGSHERWRQPLLRKTLTIPGKDGDDVPLYLEKQLEKLLAELEKLRKENS